MAKEKTQKSSVNGQESRTLAALRDALLPKLLSGELRLPLQMLRQADCGCLRQRIRRPRSLNQKSAKKWLKRTNYCI